MPNVQENLKVHSLPPSSDTYEDIRNGEQGRMEGEKEM